MFTNRFFWKFEPFGSAAGLLAWLLLLWLRDLSNPANKWEIWYMAWQRQLHDWSGAFCIPCNTTSTVNKKHNLSFHNITYCINIKQHFFIFSPSQVFPSLLRKWGRFKVCFINAFGCLWYWVFYIQIGVLYSTAISRNSINSNEPFKLPNGQMTTDHFHLRVNLEKAFAIELQILQMNWEFCNLANSVTNDHSGQFM